MVREPLVAAVVGMAGGAAAVVTTLMLEIVARGLPVRGGLLALQRDSVAVWVVESIPLVVGAAAYLVARRTAATARAPVAQAPTLHAPAAPAAGPAPPPVPQQLQAANLLARPSNEGRVRALGELIKTVKAQAERAAEESRRRSVSLANMSQELRTPLNAIVGYAELLHEDAAARQPDLAPDLQKIASAGRQLLETVNHVLDLSKIEVGQLAVVLEDVDLAQIVDEVRVAVSPLVGRNQYSSRIGRGARLVRADHMRLRQVLIQLLGNAFRATKTGTVTLDIERHTPKRDAWVALRVRDTGPGLAPHEVEGLWDQYARPDAAGGVGLALGLAIARKLVELMGGRIEVESEPSRGTTFSVILPPAGAQEEEVAPRSTIALNERLAGLRLVLVDADPAGVTLARYLEKAGVAVVHVADAASARVACRQERPRMAIVDAGLAGAWGLVEELVAGAAQVVVTSIQDGDVEPALQAGVTAFLVRPIEKRLVLATLERCLEEG